jgi:hypothetical protein
MFDRHLVTTSGRLELARKITSLIALSTDDVLSVFLSTKAGKKAMQR